MLESTSQALLYVNSFVRTEIQLIATQVWLVIASVLATFNIGKEKDLQGKEIPIRDDFLDLSGFVQYVETFNRAGILLRHSI